MDTTGTAAGRLTEALRQCAAARFSGVLRVTGQPGGTIHLSGGGICGCESPGAPGLEEILLGSQAIGVLDWEAARCAASAAERPLLAELTGRGLLGAGEAEALLRTALADATFAILSGRIDGWSTGPPDRCLFTLAPPARPGWLLAESARRRRVLASFAGSEVRACDSIAVARAVPPGAITGPGQERLLALADGQRTAVDLAFALGRGRYATLLQLTRMRASGLITTRPSGQGQGDGVQGEADARADHRPVDPDELQVPAEE